MVAGETSGDLLAGLILQGLSRRWPGLQAGGVGGPQMAAQGFDVWSPSSQLAVRGYVEVLRHYPGLVQLRRALGTRVLHENPQVFIGVDAPDFNLGLEARLRQGGVRTVHFVCPSLWAWRPERIEALRRAAEHVLCIFPFEPALLQRQGISATYVGHPLADAIPLEVNTFAVRASLGLDASRPVVALLPGSRASEVAYVAPAFLQAASLMQRRFPHMQFLLPVAPGMDGAMSLLVEQHGLGLNLRVLAGKSHAALAACDATLIASGTATLEAALFKKPMVIGYRMNPISHWLMKRKQLQPWVGLPNILSQRFVVPELLQDECQPAALAQAMGRWFEEPEQGHQIIEHFNEIHRSLRQDTALKASDAIANFLQT
jgi:lipid-A-disaccharide synthase